MYDGVRRFGRIAVAVFRTARGAQLTFLAAAVAFYAFLSLVPLLALALVISTVIGGESLVQQLLDRTDAALTPETQELLREALVGGRGRAGATAFGAVAVSWSAMRVLRALDMAFSQVYGTVDEVTFLGTVRDGLVVIVAITIGSVAMAVVVVGVELFPFGPLAPLVAALLGVVTLTVIFLPMYLVFPDRSVGPREALPGAVTAGFGWMALGSGFSLYADFAAGAALYGVLGGIFLLVTFLYAGALVLVVGAVVNVTLASDRQLQLDSSRELGLTRTMSEPRDDPPSDAGPAGGNARSDPSSANDGTVGEDAAEFDPGDRSPEEARLREEVADLRAELEEFRDDVEDRTVERETVESDLKRYVRQRVRRGHARGWGPYLVLLYGTVMTIGAFYFLSGGWSILAMIVIWLSTLGLYTLMVLVGAGLNLLGLPGRLRDRIGDWRN